MRSRIVNFLLFFAAVVLVAGCAQLPQQTLREAEKKLEEARKAGAEQYAFSQFKAAQVSLELAKKEITEENKKLPFMRKYKKILETLNSATSAAKSALTAVERTKTLIRRETTEMINQTQLRTDTLAALLKKAARRKRNTGNLAGEIDSVRTLLTVSRASLAANELLVAKEKATIAQARIPAIAKSVKKLAPPRKKKRRYRRK